MYPIIFCTADQQKYMTNTQAQLRVISLCHDFMGVTYQTISLLTLTRQYDR